MVAQTMGPYHQNRILNLIRQEFLWKIVGLIASEWYLMNQ